MEATALCTRLCISMLLLLVAEAEISDAQEVDYSVILEAPVQPVIEGDSVTLRCRNNKTSSSYTEFYKNSMFISSSDEGKMVIHSVSKSDAGPYKCLISGVGESAEKWLFVVGVVILEGPVHPVMEGESVTLYCRNSKDPSVPIADFYRHNLHIDTSYGGEMTIPRVSKTDEGPYKCSISGFGASAENQLVVQEKHLSSEENPSSDSGTRYFVLLTAIIASSVAVLLLVVGVRCFIAKRVENFHRGQECTTGSQECTCSAHTEPEVKIKKDPDVHKERIHL